MSIDPRSRTSPMHAVVRSVTVRVAGHVTTDAAAHHLGTASPLVGVRVGATLSYVSTGEAATRIACAFTDALALAERQALAWAVSPTWLGPDLQACSPAVSIQYTTPPHCLVGYQPRRVSDGQTGPAHVWVSAGPLLWEICDRTAARRLAYVWTHGARLLTTPTPTTHAAAASIETTPGPRAGSPRQAAPAREATPTGAAAQTTGPEAPDGGAVGGAPVAGIRPAGQGRLAADVRSDAELLVAYATDGDRAALAALVARHHRLMLAAAARVLGRHEVEDAAQAAWVRVATRGASYRGDAAVSTWLYRIAHRVALDLVRRADARPSDLTPDPAREAGDEQGRGDPRPANSAANEGQPPGHARGLLDDLLSLINPGQRDAIELVDLQGLDITEAAARLQVAEGTVKSRRARGRAALQGAAAARGLRFPL